MDRFIQPWTTIPREADGRFPIEPVRTDASSVRISPNMLAVRMTSKDAVAEARTSLPHHQDMFQLHIGIFRGCIIDRLPPQARTFEYVGFIDRGHLFPAVTGQLECQMGHSRGPQHPCIAIVSTAWCHHLPACANGGSPK